MKSETLVLVPLSYLQNMNGRIEDIKRAVTKTKPKITAGFSDFAKQILTNYNKWQKSANLGAYRSQRKKIVSEVKSGDTITTKRAQYKNHVFKGLIDKTFKAEHNGILIEVFHTQTQMTEIVYKY